MGGDKVYITDTSKTSEVVANYQLTYSYLTHMILLSKHLQRQKVMNLFGQTEVR